jgi:DNA-binding MarR family transcriptional regulator
MEVATRSNALTVMALGRALEVAINHTGLTGSQFRALSLVRAGITSGGTLAGFLAVKPPTVTTVMNGLVADGFVTRDRSDDDRRRVDYELTPAGDVKLDEANLAADRALELLLEELPSTERASARESVTLWRTAIESRRAKR